MFFHQGHLDEYAVYPGKLWRTRGRLLERLFVPGARSGDNRKQVNVVHTSITHYAR